MSPYIITIAREFGSGGKEIALQLSELLGIPCYERQLITLASDKSGIDESLFVETDEKLRGAQIANFLRKQPSPVVVEPHEKGFISDVNLFNIMADVIRTLAQTQSCIIVGKCADVILNSYPNVISLFIEAPRHACVRSIMKKLNVSEKRAKYLCQKTDQYRARYYNFYSGGAEWKNPNNYDCILNSERIGRRQCAELIMAYAKQRFGSDDPQKTAE
ncbi:MAG: cytidylate kinase-like family protein [Lachnospiraceae bacterium]|nr:cytidylate kinase-like family protein [Lachnospiraceae bacterium]